MSETDVFALRRGDRCRLADGAEATVIGKAILPAGYSEEWLVKLRRADGTEVILKAGERVERLPQETDR